MAGSKSKGIGGMMKAALQGMRAAESATLGAEISSTPGIVHEVKAQTDRVSQALLHGEVTQAVRELRYRTYKVDREAQYYTYFAPTLAKRTSFAKDEDHNVNAENSEGLPIVTIQENGVVTQSVLDGINQVGSYGLPPEHRIKIGRSIAPRFELEKYATRIVVKDVGDERHAILDFYVSQYKIPKNRLQNCFVNEVRRMCKEGLRSSIVNIDTVEFTTQRAYRLDDLIYFKFDHINYRGVTEFDGSYVIKFQSTYAVNQQDLVMTDYYCPELEQKYQERAPKSHNSSQVFAGANDKLFTCEVCGKQIVYDEVAVDELPSTDDPLPTDALEYFDMQIVEATYGKKMCLDCLRQYLNTSKLAEGDDQQDSQSAEFPITTKQINDNTNE